MESAKRRHTPESFHDIVQDCDVVVQFPCTLAATLLTCLFRGAPKTSVEADYLSGSLQRMCVPFDQGQDIAYVVGVQLPLYLCEIESCVHTLM